MNVLRDGLFFTDDAFRAKLVYFNNDYDNYITRSGVREQRGVGTFFFFENVPDLTVSGYEVSLSYATAGVFSDLDFSTFDEPFDLPSQARIDQPEYTGTLTVGTRWFDDSLVLGGRLNVFGEPNLDGPLGPNELLYWSAQEIVDIFSSYAINDDITLGFSVENVAERFYTAPLYVSRIPGPGRTGRVNLTVQF